MSAYSLRVSGKVNCITMLSASPCYLFDGNMMDAGTYVIILEPISVDRTGGSGISLMNYGSIAEFVYNYWQMLLPDDVTITKPNILGHILLSQLGGECEDN